MLYKCVIETMLKYKLTFFHIYKPFFPEIKNVLIKKIISIFLLTSSQNCFRPPRAWPDEYRL